MVSAHAVDISQLTTDEKLALIERLWDSLAQTPDLLPVPDWHRDTLDERVARLSEHTGPRVEQREALKKLRHLIDE